MLDIKYIRENQEKVQEAAKNKNIELDVTELLKIDDKRKELITQIDQLRAERNELAATAKSGRPTEEQIELGRKLKEDLADLETELGELEFEYKKLIKAVPNIPTEDTPIGKSEEDNQVVYEWGQKRDFEFKPKNHWEIAQQRDWIDKDRAAKVTGARFAYLKGDLVLLQMALVQYVFSALTNEETLDKIIKFGKLGDVSKKSFIPVLPPLMIKTEIFDAMDRLEPADDRYKIEEEELWLQGSAEHVLGSMHQGEILEASKLPLRYIGYATSFRREAGTYGKDMEGIIRMHQFDKLEMEIIALPEQGLNEHFLAIAIQEYFLQQLNLPYRKILKCTADIGKPNSRGVDMEVWLPGQNNYRETHTADYMADYQARRLKTRARLKDGSLVYIHTIDATAFACGRALVAILENYQNADGSVTIPEVLRSFMSGGKEVIGGK